MAADTPTSSAAPAVEEPKPTNGATSVDVVGQHFINALAKSFAAQVTATLAEELAAAKDALAAAKKEKEDEDTAAAAAAAAAKAETETEAAEAEKGKRSKKEKPKRVEAKDMLKELYKIDSIKDRESGDRKFVPWNESRTRKADDDTVPDEHSKWILVLRRVFGYDNELQRTKLDVKSPLLREILKETVPPVKAAMDSEKASAHWPNDEIFRYREHIMKTAEKKGGLALEHAEVLRKLIESEYSGRIHDIQYLFPTGTTNYEILREAFWPGDLVVDACSSRVYRVTGASYVNNPWEHLHYLSVQAEYIDHNGKEFGAVPTEFEIHQFEGVEYLKDLSVFPLKYHPQQEELKATLLKRGKRFAALKGQHHLNHDGVAVTFTCPPSRVTVKSRIMVDTATHNRINPNVAINTRKSITSELVSGELTEEHYILCTDRIPIFSFQDKRFYRANIENISAIVYNDRVFDQLVLPDSQKELVRVLVENHSKGADFDDFVEGKGKGLVSVLHGPPGVGKTMTAEAVAEYTRRPLYIVTSGELGSTPSQMESELERILDLAKTFRAVLLLDEADVFLEQRTTHDLIRNALVSIFLRQLEYYQGILFLTTNRVSTFDEAFHSRIHISLYYQNLTPEAREQVWRNFGAKMDVDLSDDDYQQAASQELNGRQIKNIFRTSQALAADRGERISMRHIRTVLEVMKGFDLAKMKAHGGVNGMEK